MDTKRKEYIMNNEESTHPMNGSKRLLNVLEDQIVPLLDQLLEQQNELIKKMETLAAKGQV